MGALVDARKALLLAEAAKDQRAIADSYLLLSQIHARRTENLDAANRAQQALDLYRTLKLQLPELQAEIALADALWYMDPGKGQPLYKHAYTVGKEIDSKEIVVRALLGLGRSASAQGDTTEAMARFGEQRQIYDSLNDKRGMATSEWGMAVALMKSNPSEALSHYLAAAKLSDEIDNYSIEVQANVFAASMALNLGNVDVTDKLLSTALYVAKQHGNPQDIVAVLLSSANAALHQRSSRPLLPDLLEAKEIAYNNHLTYLELKAHSELSKYWKNAADYDRSLGSLLEGLKLADELQSWSDKVSLSLSISALYKDVGDNRLARSYAEQALAWSRAANIPEDQILALAELASLHRASRDFHGALRLDLEGLKVSRTAGPSAEALENSSLALDYLLLGDHEKQLAHALECLRLSEQIGDQEQIPPAFGMVATAYQTVGQAQRAIEYNERAYELALKLKRWDEFSIFAVDRVYRYILSGDLLKARDSAQEGLKVLSLDQSRSADIYKALATMEGLNHNWQAALSAASIYQNIVTPRAIPRELYEAHKLKGWLLLASGETTAGYSELKQADVALDTLWDYSLKQKGPSAFFEDKIDLYVELVRAAYRMHSQDPSNQQLANDAFVFSEKSRARNLADVFANSQADSLSTLVPRDVLVNGHKLESALNNAREEYLRTLAIGTNQLADSKKAQYQKQLLAQSSFIADVRAKYRAYASLRYPQPEAPVALIIKDDEALVEFFVTDEEVFRWVLKAERGTTAITRFDRIPVQGDKFTANVGALLNAIQNRRDPVTITNDLYNLLFKSCEVELSRARTLWIVANSVLEVVPFETLTDKTVPGSSIIEHYNVNYLPSASLLAFREKESRRVSQSSSIFLVGDPSFPKSSGSNDLDLLTSVVQAAKDRGWSLDPLPATRYEVNGIADLFKKRGLPAVTLLGSDAKKAALQSKDLSKYRYIHFATHALSSGDLPYLSEPSLVLSFDQNSDDAFFTLDDILALKLDADLVVLSACNTATGKYIAGEGPTAISRAFMYAGAKSVVASLWPVADESTAIFMQEFYAFLLQGEPQGEALRHAKLELRRKGYQDPYFWAPFILIGY